MTYCLLSQPNVQQMRVLPYNQRMVNCPCPCAGLSSVFPFGLCRCAGTWSRLSWFPAVQPLYVSLNRQGSGKVGIVSSTRPSSCHWESLARGSCVARRCPGLLCELCVMRERKKVPGQSRERTAAAEKESKRGQDKKTFPFPA